MRKVLKWYWLDQVYDLGDEWPIMAGLARMADALQRPLEERNGR